MDMREINRQVMAEFRASGGELSGPMAGAPILLLPTTGREPGAPHPTPLGFGDADGRLAVAAANGGSDNHPDWVRNIERESSVTVEVPGAAIPSVAEIATGAERDRLLTMLVESLPGMADHVGSTNRAMPVIILSERR